MSFQFGSQGLGNGGLIPTGAPQAFVTDPVEFGVFSAGLNDNPLDFKGCPGRSQDNKDKDDCILDGPNGDNKKEKRRKERNRRDTDRSKDDSDSNLSNQDTLSTGSNLPNVWGTPMMGMGYPMVGMNVIMDPGMLTMNNYGMIPPMLASGPDSTGIMAPDANLLLNPVKDIIHCKSCTLFPPNPNAPPPTTRERPSGCRTVFVGGLPENMTEEIITEVFERCGEITTLRLSKKNFCHIRFVYEASVDAAIYMSGYRIRIGSNGESANTGRLHVDYAQARDDQYEWECRQRQLQREQRHRERMEEERLRPPSPPPIVHYTDHEAIAISEKIKQDDTFTKAVLVVITWLERGDCSKRNANNFYSMIQSTNSHVRRLLNEKSQYEEELKKAKEIMKGRMQGLLLQFSQIERLFVAACHKKVWDHFTKAQRKNIESWKKMAMEIKNVQLDEPGSDKADDEMDVSDEDEPIRKRNRMEMIVSNGDDNLKDENENLKCQIEAYKNEVEVVRMDHKKELETKEKQLKMLQQTLQGMQQQLIEAKRRQTEEESRNKDLNGRIKSLETRSDAENVAEETTTSVAETIMTDEGRSLNECDARLIGLISTFLNVHPFGANLDYIWSYVNKLELDRRPADIEVLLNRFPNVFKQELIGIGANIERRWMFNAYNNSTRSN